MFFLHLCKHCSSWKVVHILPAARLPSTRRSSRWSLYFSFRKHLPRSWHMAYPFLPSCFGHSNDTWLGEQVMTPHIMPCSDVLGLNCSHRLPFVWVLSKTSLPPLGWYAALFVGCSSVSVVTGLRVWLPRNRVWMSGRDGWCFPSRRHLGQPSFSCSVDTGSSSSGDKAVRAWRWPLTSI